MPPLPSSRTGFGRPSTWSVNRLLACVAFWVFAAGGHAGAPRVLLFDDYYQRARDEAQFGQGVARGGPDLRNQSNFYSPEANAIANGTFAFAELISDRFRVEVSRAPLAKERLEQADAFMLVCPVRAEKGGRANLTEREADLLEAFVDRGGSLILVANSITDPAQSDLDLDGLNGIARRFGVRFLARQTDTVSVPIPRDHPFFDDASDLIFGNGTTLEILPSAASTTQVLLESPNARVPGPIAVLATRGKGKVLLLGDAGTFGNAHLFRQDTGHTRGVQQLMAALLPDGPAPRYGWSDRLRLRVRLKEEQVISGYPELLRVFSLPHPPGTESFTSTMRPIDLAAASGQAQAAGAHDYVSAVARREAEFTLAVGAPEGGGFRARWDRGPGTLPTTLLPSGRQLEPGVPTNDDVVSWQGVLLHDLLCAPLRAHAVPGEQWTADAWVGLPQLRLAAVPRRVEAPASFRFEGITTLDGKACYLFKRTIWQNGADWSPGDLVGPEFAPQFAAGTVQLSAAGQLVVTRYWIARDTRLPLRTETKVAAALWWQDARYPDHYHGSHDSKTYENWSRTKFILNYGRILTAEFEPL
ncbi:MAG: DUF4350 domain-containing protein [Opitutaceae bacterium]|nr:DUF4350 domain-containing protein [Opitutaceae bacterium]